MLKSMTAVFVNTMGEKFGKASREVKYNFKLLLNSSNFPSKETNDWFTFSENGKERTRK